MTVPYIVIWRLKDDLLGYQYYLALLSGKTAGC